MPSAAARTMPIDRTPEGWSAVAEAYEQHVVPFTKQYAQDALLAAKLRRGERVLDVACGPGTLSLAAADLGADVTATDFSPEMIQRLRQRLMRDKVANVRAEVMDAQALSVPDASYDAAFSIFGIIFVPDRMRAFRELHRSLKTGGRALVTGWSTPDKVRFLSVLQNAAQETVPDLPPPPEPPSILTLSDPQKFRTEMETAGFSNVELRTLRHDWVWPDARTFWEKQPQVSPAFQPLLERVGAANANKLGDIVIRDLTHEFGAGPLRLSGEAHLAYATKA